MTENNHKKISHKHKHHHKKSFIESLVDSLLWKRSNKKNYDEKTRLATFGKIKKSTSKINIAPKPVKKEEGIRKEYIRYKKKHKKKRSFISRLFNPEHKKSIINKPINIVKIKDDAEDKKLKKKRISQNIYSTANSLIIFLISYFLVYLIYQFTVIFTASFWGLDSTLYYYDLAFNDFSPLWTRFNIIFITLSGPVVSLIIGVLFYKVFFKSKKIKSYTKLFFLWIAFNGFNRFFGGFVSGISTDEGFGYVANWLYMNVFFKILFALIFLFILILIGYYSTNHFLETSNYFHRIKRGNRRLFLLNQALIPWILGSLLIYLIKIPHNMPYDSIMLFTMGFLVIPVFFNHKVKPKLNLQKEKRKINYINWSYFIILLIIIPAFRIGLNEGLHFIIRIYISISPA